MGATPVTRASVVQALTLMGCPGHTALWERPQGRDAARLQLTAYTHSYRVTILRLETQ